MQGNTPPNHSLLFGDSVKDPFRRVACFISCEHRTRPPALRYPTKTVSHQGVKHLTKIVLRLFQNIPGGEERSGAAGELSTGEFKRRAGRSPLSVATKRKHPS